VTDETRLKKLEADVTRLTYQMWGLNGSNGLVSEVRALRQEIKADRKLREQEREEIEGDEKQRRRDRRLLLFGMTSAALGPIIGFALARLAG
jgi:hypothetical protein